MPPALRRRRRVRRRLGDPLAVPVPGALLDGPVPAVHVLALIVLGRCPGSTRALSAGPAHDSFSNEPRPLVRTHGLVPGQPAARALDVLFGLPVELSEQVVEGPLGVVGDFGVGQSSVVVVDVLVERSSSSAESDASGDSSGSDGIEEPPF